jgi:hypothetical protein
MFECGVLPSLPGSRLFGVPSLGFTQLKGNVPSWWAGWQQRVCVDEARCVLEGALEPETGSTELTLPTSTLFAESDNVGNCCLPPLRSRDLSEGLRGASCADQMQARP